MRGRIASLQRSGGGVPKTAVTSAFVSEKGMEGDRQRDRRFHGGPDRALCLYSADLIDQLRLDGHPIEPGTTGENVTIAGLDWRRMTPGARVRLGDVVAELTAYAAPCRTIRHSFTDEEFTRISQRRFPGWSRVYARIITPGTIKPGDPVELVDGRADLWED